VVCTAWVGYHEVLAAAAGCRAHVMESIPFMDMLGDKKLDRAHDAGETALAIGIGCKRGCCSEVIVALVERAIAVTACAGAPAALFTHEAKKSEAGLASAAKALGLPLVFLDGQVLRQASLRAATNSPRVMAMFGLPSIAEAAALAGAGPVSVLLVARMSDVGASCAIAGRQEP
jgi:cobalt-precorrin 5A hydrolase